MAMEREATKVEDIISAGRGVIVVRFTLYDEHGRSLQPQPGGRFQVWQVIGTAKLIKPCDTPEEAAGWLQEKENSMFRLLGEEEMFDLQKLETALTANQIEQPQTILRCRVDLVTIKDDVEASHKTQLTKQERYCLIGRYPILLGGPQLADEPPTSQQDSPPPPQPRRPRR